MNNFNAVSWISNNYADVYIDEETQRAVVNFSLMWNVFEGQFCDNGANVAKFELLAEEITKRNYPEQEVKEIFLFYRNLFIENGETNWRFESLEFRRNDRKDFVKEVILNHNHISKDAFWAALIIIYRIRNNLFHGVKAFHLLHNQSENLNTASAFLALIMEQLKNIRY